MIELPLIALIVSLTGTTIGFLTWQRKDERDRYSKERSLQHALDNFAAVSAAVVQLEDKVDVGFQATNLELTQMRTILMINQRLIVESTGNEPTPTIGRKRA